MSQGADLAFCKLIIEAKSRCRFCSRRVGVAGDNAAWWLVDLLEQRLQLRIALVSASDVPQTSGNVEFVYNVQVASISKSQQLGPKGPHGLSVAQSGPRQTHQQPLLGVLERKLPVRRFQGCDFSLVKALQH